MRVAVLCVVLLVCATAAGAATNARVGGDWTRFGYTAARSSAGPARTGITAANVARLQHRRVDLDGTVDASAIYLRGVHGHDTLFVTTTYGRTEAIDADSGAVLWRFTPPGYSSWAGSAQITTATPAADPDRAWIYAASPDGRIHKLSVADGAEAKGWPVTITRDPTHEKIAGSLNLSRGHLLAATGGYIGDAPPYQGHVAVLDAASGRLLHVWNSLCSDRHELIQPSSCGASDSAIWGRAGVVVEPGTGDLLVATGNAPWNGTTNWGDSTLKLSPDASRLLGNWTPTNEAELNSNDVDLGSTSPVPVAAGLAVQGGKDGKLRLLDLRRLNGTTRAGPRRGGELQTVSTPGATDLFTAPAVWRSHGRTWIFLADGDGTAAWTLGGRRLRPAWSNGTPGTSPVVAGGLLYVYDPQGGLRVYAPGSGKQLADLAAGAGHWNSPIVTDGRVVLPEGNANDHATSGVLDIYRLP
jgi:hypothetical protein